MATALEQLGKHHRIDQIHQNLTLRGLIRARSIFRPPCGIASKCSMNDGRCCEALLVSCSYAATDSTTTAGLPRLVTVCGVPLQAASTTALKLFFASCTDHSDRSMWSLHLAISLAS